MIERVIDFLKSYNLVNDSVLAQKIVNTNVNLNKCGKEKAYLAGMIHDCAKYLSDKEIEDYVNKYEIYLDPIEDGNRS
ncbi:hypothetical protein D1N57_20500, partial [Clostridioides difficile]